MFQWLSFVFVYAVFGAKSLMPYNLIIIGDILYGITVQLAFVNDAITYFAYFASM